MRMIQIGLGAWGASWADVVTRSPHWDLVGLVDLDEDALDEVGRHIGLPAAAQFTSLDEALGPTSPDAALVVVPPPHHASVSIPLLEAGVHCLIEKPLAPDMPSALSIVEAAERSGATAMVSQNYRFKRAPRTVRRLIRDGVLGDVGQVRVNFQKRPPFTGFRLEMDEPLITDMAVHHLDQVRGVLGIEPAVVRARSWNPPWSPFAGNASCRIEMEGQDGAIVVYTGSWASTGRHTSWDGDWDVEGDRGGLYWGDNRVEIRFASLFDTVFMRGAVERGGVMEVELDALEYEERDATLAELAGAIAEGRPAETGARDNLRSLALVLGAIRSAEAGGKDVLLTDPAAS
jgi:predicted dehydrogenase